MIRKNIYRWHRWLSLVSALPILMWSVSGLLHQAGSWAKPALRLKQVVEASPAPGTVKISLQEALRKNKIDSFAGSRLIQYANEYFYQVRIKKFEPNVYLSAQDGRMLHKGDEKYAVDLVKRLLADSSFVVHRVSFVTGFSEMYRASSKLLPVYAVHLHDADDTRIYVDTHTGKLAKATNRQHHSIHQWFGYLHAWRFLDRYKPAKEIALGIFAIISFAAAASGIYLYLILPAMDKRKRQYVWNRRRNNHRVTGIVSSCLLLLFSFSGAYRALVTTRENVIFSHLHMFRFAEAVGADFRFWLLIVFALLCLLATLTGIILATRLAFRKRKQRVQKAIRTAPV